jgi:N-acetylmuramoyl-L-alanine amidase
VSPQNRRRAYFLLAPVAPVCFAGWLLYQAVGGSGDDGGHSDAKPQSEAGQSSSALSSPPATHSSGAKAKPSHRKPSSHPPRKTPQSAKKPLAGKVIVLDPGHNPTNRLHASQINRLVNIGTGSKPCDTTGTSTNAGYSEASYTLDVARRARKLLQAQGATVKFTQDGDRPYGPCVDERAAIGNRAHADAAVSIHADGAAAGDRGFHVILPSSVHAGAADTRAIAAPSKRLGLSLKSRFAADTSTSPSNYTGGGTGFTVRGDLGGLNLSKVPKVFIECGNMRDARDAARLSDAGWRQRAAHGIADGIAGFLRS